LRSLAAEPPAKAEACFHQALAIARRHSVRASELRTTMSRARLWPCQGKRTDARELLTPIYGWFTKGCGTADLQDAQVLLEKLGG
jgi:predicted ATPase